MATETYFILRYLSSSTINIFVNRRLDGVSHNLKMINGRYSAVASVTLRDADLPSPAEFICTLRIPQAQYAVRKEGIYYPGKTPLCTSRFSIYCFYWTRYLLCKDIHFLMKNGQMLHHKLQYNDVGDVMTLVCDLTFSSTYLHFELIQKRE